MSAWLCSSEHINALVCFAMDHCAPVDIDMGRVLLHENMESLRYRYSNVEDEEALAQGYRFERVNVAALVASHLETRVPVAVNGRASRQRDIVLTEKNLATAIVKLCDCYDYQACEHPSYGTSSAARFVERVKACAIAKGGQDSGPVYDAMPWGL